VPDDAEPALAGGDRAAARAFAASGLPEREWLAFRRRWLAEAWRAKLAEVGCDLAAEFPDVQDLLLDWKVVGDLLAGVEWFLDAVLRNWPDPDAMSRIRGHDQEWWRANARQRRAANEDLDQERAARAERAWREEERRRRAVAAAARRRAERTVDFGPGQKEERWAYVLKRRAEGATYKAIGAEIGVAQGRASQIVAQAERRAARLRKREERKRRAWQKVAADGIRIRRVPLQSIEGLHWDEVWTVEQQWVWDTPPVR
jgi:hypothetical protein